MSKKKKKKKGAGLPSAEPSAPAPEKTASPRRRRWPVGVAVVLALAIGAVLVFASTHPGLESPYRELETCGKRLKRLGTGALLWARAHDGAYPDTLATLRAEGTIPPSDDLYRDPSSGEPYRLLPGIRASMPPSTVLLACPHGVSHRVDQTARGGKVVHVIQFIGADARIHYEAVAEGGAPEKARSELGGLFQRRMADQDRVLALVVRAKGREPDARDALAKAASDPSLHETARALALWGMGESEDPAYLTLLRGRVQAIHALGDEFALAAALALLRLGDHSAVPLLVDVLTDQRSEFREAACAALKVLARGANPPAPPCRAYAPAAVRAEDARIWRAWWDRNGAGR